MSMSGKEEEGADEELSSAATSVGVGIATASVEVSPVRDVFPPGWKRVTERSRDGEAKRKILKHGAVGEKAEDGAPGASTAASVAGGKTATTTASVEVSPVRDVFPPGWKHGAESAGGDEAERKIGAADEEAEGGKPSASARIASAGNDSFAAEPSAIQAERLRAVQVPPPPPSSAAAAAPSSPQSEAPTSSALGDEDERTDASSELISAYRVVEPEIVPAERVVPVVTSDDDGGGGPKAPSEAPTSSSRRKCSVYGRILAAFALLVAVVVTTLTVTGQFGEKDAVSERTSTPAAELTAEPTAEPTADDVCCWNWTQVGADLEGPLDDDQWGEFVALAAVDDDDEENPAIRFSVSAKESPVGGEGSGSVYAYDWNEEDGSFDLVGQLLHGSSDKEKVRGKLSKDGRRLVVSAPYYGGQNGTERNIGRVAVYELRDGAWELLGDPIEGVAAKERFGAVVDISRDGSVVAASATFSNGKKGSVRVFQYVGDQWIRLGQQIDGPVEGEQFGWGLALSGSGTVVAASPRGRNKEVDFGDMGFNSGFVRVYRYTAGEWAPLGRTLSGEAAGDNFGRSLSLNHDGNIVAGGTWAPDATDTNRPSNSRVRVFSFDEVDGDWTLVSGAGLSPCGRSNWVHRVSLSGDGTHIAIACGEFGPESIGSATVFQLVEGSWRRRGDTIVGVQQNFSPYIAISSEGDYLLTGYPISRTNGEAPAKGLVRLFKVKDLN